MQSRDGDVELSVVLDTKGLKSDAQKIKRDLEQGVGSVKVKSDVSSMQKSSGSVKDISSAIEKAQEQAKSLVEQINEAKNAKIPTEEYTKLGEQLAWAEKELEKTTAQLDHMALTGEEGNRTFDRLANKEYELGESIKNIEGEMQGMVDLGEAFTIGDPEQVSELEQQYDAVVDKIVLMEEAQRNANIAAQDTSQQFQEIANKIISFQQIQKAFSKLSSILDSVNAKLKKFVSNLIKASFNAIKGGLANIVNGFKQLAPAIQKANNGLRIGIAQVLGYTIGIRGLFSLFGKLRSAITEGIQYLAQYNDGNNETNRSISMLLTSLNQLKGAWASAFAPILTAVAPVLNYIIGLLTKAANAIAQFMALLAGKSTWMKATAAQQNFAKGMDKTGSSAKKANKEAEKLKGTLAGFDDLDVLNPQEETGLDDIADDLGGGAGGAEIPVTFEEVPIDPWFKDLLDKLKEMWEKADFTELGKAIGEWLKKALDSIPWDIIKQFARKLAKSLATFINGFIEVEGLGKSIGKTLAEAINTAFEFLDEFVRDFHWDSLGKFIGEGLLGFVETIDYDLIGGALGAGLWGAIQAAFYTVKTFTEGEGWETLSEGITTIINRFVEELGRIDEESGLNGWEMAGDTAYNIIHGIITSLANILDDFPSDEIVQGFQDFMNRIDWGQIGVDLHELAITIIGILADTIGDSSNWQLVGEKLADFLNGIDFVGLGIDLVQLALNVLSGIGEGFKSCKANLTAGNKFVVGLGEALIVGLLAAGGMLKLAGVGLKIFSFLAPALQTSMIQALGAMITDGGFLAAVGTAGATIAGALAAAIGGYFAGLGIGAWLFPEDKQWYKDFSWDQIFGDPEDLLEGLKLWFQDIWEALPEAIRIMITASNPFLSIGMAIVDGLLEGMGITSFSTGFKDFWEGLILWVKDIFGIHSPSTVFMEIGDNLVQGFLDGLKEKYEAVIEFFTGLFDAIIAVWEAFKATVASLWEAFKSAVAERLETLRTDIETKWNAIKSKSQEIWTLLKDKVVEIVTKLKESAQEKVNLIKEKILEIWTKLKEGTIEKFNLIKEKIIDVFEKVKEGIKAPINGALEIIEGFVNTVIRGLNFFIDSVNQVIGKITSSLPSDVVSKIGIEGALTIEPIPEISLPRLARGAVIPPNKEFLAVLGDQKNGTNIEAPLDTIKEAFADVVANMNVQNSGYAEMELDGETFARLIVPYVISELKREGFNVSVIGA